MFDLCEDYKWFSTDQIDWWERLGTYILLLGKCRSGLGAKRDTEPGRREHHELMLIFTNFNQQIEKSLKNKIFIKFRVIYYLSSCDFLSSQILWCTGVISILAKFYVRN